MQFAAGDTMVVRASYQVSRRVRPLFQVAIVDVDTGVIVTTATGGPRGSAEVAQAGAIECRFPDLMLRPRHYVLRLSITDDLQLASYDTVSAGPRFAVVSQGTGVDMLADEQEGLVSMPFEIVHLADEPVTR